MYLQPHATLLRVHSPHLSRQSYVVLMVLLNVCCCVSHVQAVLAGEKLAPALLHLGLDSSQQPDPAAAADADVAAAAAAGALEEQ